MKTNKNYFKRFWPVILVIVFLITATLTYAYWDSLTGDEPGDIIIGEGVTLKVEGELFGDSGNLVPEGSVLKDGDVEELVFNYTVKLDKEITGTLNLDITYVVGLKEGTATEAEQGYLDKLVNLVIVPSSTTLGNTPIQVTVTVTLNEPGNQTEYDFIKEKELTFTLTFTASKPN